MIYILFLFIGGQRRTLSGYIGRFAKRVTDNVDDAEVSLLKEYNKRDPEYVIRWFERSRPYQWYSPGILAEYVKALVKTDKLDKTELLSVIQEGIH